MSERSEIDQLQTELVEKARELGFASIGFADAHDDPRMAERLSAWLEAGHHGSMGWMERDPSVRSGPQAMWPEARSVIALGANYAPADNPLNAAEPEDRARISVYAQGQDYHDVLKKALKALARWLVAETEKRGLGETRMKLFVDTAPVMEKPLAQRAGLGWQGKHTNLVSMEHGSCFSPQSTPRCPSRPTARTRTAADRAARVRMPARPTPSPTLTRSMRGAVSPTSRSSIRGRSPRNFARRWATASMAATIA